VLRIDGYDHPITVASPFEADQLLELDWYFEQYLRFPFTDQVRARQAGESITAYGEALFQQLFASDAAREAYGVLKIRACPDQLAITVIGSPAFQGVHWEALKDARGRDTRRPRLPATAACRFCCRRPATWCAWLRSRRERNAAAHDRMPAPQDRHEVLDSGAITTSCRCARPGQPRA
jgi:sugar (pentulose or hexulose) kinase